MLSLLCWSHCDNLECLGKKLEVQEMPEKVIAGLGKFRSQKGFLGYDRVSSPVSRQWLPVSRHGSQAASSCLVAT